MDFIKQHRIGLFVAALVILGLAYAFRPEAIPVDVAVIDRGHVEIGITDDGVTRIRDVYQVSAPVTGRITRIEIEPGDTVIAGQTEIVQIRLRPPGLLDVRTRTELENALASSRAAENVAAADLQRSEAALDLAKKTLKRTQELAEQGFATKARLDEALSLVEERLAAVSMADAALSQRISDVARADAALKQDENGGVLAPVVVAAPTSGRVLQVLRESEAIVTEGTPLVEIGDPKQIEIVVDLLSRDAVRISRNDPVRITRWGGEPIMGKVRLIEPFGFLKISALGIEEQRVNVIIDVDDSQGAAARLGHGYQVDATVIVWSEDEALRLPIGATFRIQENWYVFRIDQDRADLVQVELGQMNEQFAQVKKGVEVGDRLILDPGSSISDGVRVRPRPPLSRR